MKSTANIILVGVVLVLCLCFQAAAAAGTGAKYDFRTWECDIDESGFRLKVHHKITIYDETEIGYKELSFSESDFVKLKNVTIHVLDANGNEIYKRTKKDMTKACGYAGYSLYSDNCVYYTSLDAPHFPYSIEYEYEKVSSSLFFWGDVDFEQYIPVDYASYTLRTPHDFNFRHKFEGLKHSFDTYEDGPDIVYVWNAGPIPKKDRIRYAPAEFSALAELTFVAEDLKLGRFRLEGCTWENIGHWYTEMYQDKYLPIPDESLVTDTALEKDIHEQVKSHYEDITANIRYVAIEIGVGGWQPYAASLTQKRGYGDCKDMSTLLVSRLQNNDIEAFQVLVRTRGSGPLSEDFAALGFGHVISVCVADEDTVWMDPTCGNCPFGELPWQDEDIQVLVVTDNGGELWRTPASTPKDNLTERVTRYRINGDFKANFQTTMTVHGNRATGLRGYLAGIGGDELRRKINDLFRGSEKKFKIDSFTVINLNDKNKPISINISATMLQHPKKIVNSLYCNPFIFSGLSRREKEDLTDREVPLDLVYPSLTTDIVTIIWDSTLAVDSVSIPKNDSLSFPFGELGYSASKFADGGQDSVQIEFSKSHGLYSVPPESFPDFETYRKKYKKLLKKHVKLYLSDN